MKILTEEEIEARKKRDLQPQKAILCTEQNSYRGIILTENGRVCCSVWHPHIEKRNHGILDGGVDFLKRYSGSDSKSEPMPFLTQIKDAKFISGSPTESQPGGYAGPGIETWEITKFDGETCIVWVYSVGYSEGYLFEIFLTKNELNKYLKELGKRHWTALECFECGARYDSPGYVEPGQMGCVRCN